MVFGTTKILSTSGFDADDGWIVKKYESLLILFFGNYFLVPMRAYHCDQEIGGAHKLEIHILATFKTLGGSQIILGRLSILLYLAVLKWFFLDAILQQNTKLNRKEISFCNKMAKTERFCLFFVFKSQWYVVSSWQVWCFRMHISTPNLTPKSVHCKSVDYISVFSSFSFLWTLEYIYDWPFKNLDSNRIGLMSVHCCKQIKDVQVIQS